MSVPVIAPGNETPVATALRSKDLLSIADLAPDEISLILDTAEAMKEIGSRAIKKVPALRGKTVVNLFSSRARGRAPRLRLPKNG